MADIRNIHIILIGNVEQNKSLGKPRPRWEHNIKIGLKDIGREGVDSISWPRRESSGM
jgi:hypothetical protein